VSRLLAVALGAVVLVAGIFGLMALFNSRDDAGVQGSGGGTAAAGPGTLEPDRGARHAPSEDRTSPDPPTSGPHQPRNVGRDARELTDDQVLHALELGDVVLLYPGRRPPAELAALQEDVAGPFDAEIAAAGQAVVLARAPGTKGVQALAWRRRLRAARPSDPALRAFAERWLGEGRAGQG
jgi:hypothetical protein